MDKFRSYSSYYEQQLEHPRQIRAKHDEYPALEMCNVM